MFRYVSSVCAKYYALRYKLHLIKVGVLLDPASKFALFSVSGLKDEKLIKKQTYAKTETCKFLEFFLTFQLNVIKIDRYNCELYPFKVGAFFETRCM